MIDQIHRETGHPIRPIGKVLCVPGSSYYHAATPTATAVKDQTTGARIEPIFRKHRRRYGYRRIYEDLVEEGLICGHTRVRRLMAERGLTRISHTASAATCCGPPPLRSGPNFPWTVCSHTARREIQSAPCGHGSSLRLATKRYEKSGLKAIQPGNYVPKTSDGKADKPSPNRLFNAAMPTAPDTDWAGDITFIPTQSGWLYTSPHQLFGFRSSWKKTGTPGR